MVAYTRGCSEMATNSADLLEVNQRVAMVSGASRGIGEAIARRLLDDGYRLSLGVRDVVATREKFSNHRELAIEHFDAVKPKTAQTWVSKTLERFGTIDALINNAGIWKQVNFAFQLQIDDENCAAIIKGYKLFLRLKPMRKGDGQRKEDERFHDE